MTVWVLAGERVTVKTRLLVPELPSEVEASAIERAEATVSSFWMVARPWPSPRVALVGLERLRRKSSSPSGAVSPVTLTATVRLVAPGEKLRLPEAAV